MINKDYGFDDPQKRKETLELIKKVVNDHKNNLKLELTVKALSMTCTLIDTQEQIIEDQSERIAIMEAEMQGWIPVSERLPEDDGFYLVCGGGLMPWIAELRTFMNVRGWCSNVNMPVVKMWMPLPKPPKEGDQ